VTIYTVNRKKQDTRLLSVISPNGDYFQNSCTDRFISKFAIKLFLNIPRHIKGVATLRCDILRSENSDSLKRVLWLVINYNVV